MDVRERHHLAAFCRQPDLGPNLQPKHVPSLGIKLVTLWFAG